MAIRDPAELRMWIHDLRTPLTLIVGTAALLESESDIAKANSMARSISEAAASLDERITSAFFEIQGQFEEQQQRTELGNGAPDSDS